MRIGNYARQAEGHQRRRMRVHDRPQIGAGAINVPMERKLRRRLMRADDRAIGLHLHDIVARERAFVDAGGRNPDIAVVVAHGKIPARRRRHPIFVNAVHDHYKLIGRMLQFKMHNFFPLSHSSDSFIIAHSAGDFHCFASAAQNFRKLFPAHFA